jgi:AraC-like DNA-binding protein
VIYIVYFDKAYKQSLKDFETYYDGDADHKLKWVRFCYAFSMLTNIFILVYLGIYWASEYKIAIAGIYTLWYLLYMLYLSSNFISFLGSHKLVLDAFAYKTLSGQDLMRRLDENRKRKALKTRKKGETEEFVLQDNTEAEFKRLERALEHWVEAKRFREYDRTRDEIASELHTSKEALHMYFATRVGVDFRTWRTSLRIAEAKNLLLENKDASINIIAEACGFSDKSNFHRQFVKIVGCSPKEWRDSSGNYTR